MSAFNAGLFELYGKVYTRRGFLELFNSSLSRFELMPSIKNPIFLFFALFAAALALFLIFVSAAVVSNHTWGFGRSLLGAALALIIISAFVAALLFIYYAADLLVVIGFYLFFQYSFFCITINWVNDPSLIDFGWLPLLIMFLISLLLGLPALPAWLVGIIGVISRDKDRQAHFLFLLSMAALGWALWLQSGGHWQQMAALNIPFVVPLLNWPVPLTESIGFPFAIFGYVHDPAGSVVSGIAQADSDEIIVLLVTAALLLFVAKARLKNAGTPLHPALPLLTLALLLASVCLDIALHWGGAPVLHPALILFNRAFAVLAVGVLLFWWGNIPIGGEDIPGAENDMGMARGKAAMRALKICFWCVGLVWAMTAASHWGSEFRHAVKVILAAFWMVPARMAINFPNDYNADLQQYHKAKQMWEQSYRPARIVPTKAEIDGALGD